MAGYYSRDIYRSIADLSAKRAQKPKRTCCDCGREIGSMGAPKRCPICSADKHDELVRARYHRLKSQQK